MGELDNTYIFYTADHGIAIGRHGLQGKQNLYQHTWRVPFIVKGPGIKPGSRVEGNIYLLDVLATLCDLAGISAPETNEGISFRPVLEGKQATVRDVALRRLQRRHQARDAERQERGLEADQVRRPGRQGARNPALQPRGESPRIPRRSTTIPTCIALTGQTPGRRASSTSPATRGTRPSSQEMEALLLAEMRRLDDPWRLWNQPDDGLTPPPQGPLGGQGKARKGGEVNPSLPETLTRSRAPPMKSILAKIGLLVASCGILPAASAPRLLAADPKPNVILIMADDFGYECVTANGGQSYQTPNLDRLAADGVRFEHCHVQPLCTPTRVQLMTGRYNVRNYLNFGTLDREARRRSPTC